MGNRILAPPGPPAAAASESSTRAKGTGPRLAWKTEPQSHPLPSSAGTGLRRPGSLGRPAHRSQQQGACRPRAVVGVGGFSCPVAQLPCCSGLGFLPLLLAVAGILSLGWQAGTDVSLLLGTLLNQQTTLPESPHPNPARIPGLVRAQDRLTRRFCWLRASLAD